MHCSWYQYHCTSLFLSEYLWIPFFPDISANCYKYNTPLIVFHCVLLLWPPWVAVNLLNYTQFLCHYFAEQVDNKPLIPCVVHFQISSSGAICIYNYYILIFSNIYVLIFKKNNLSIFWSIRKCTLIYWAKCLKYELYMDSQSVHFVHTKRILVQHTLFIN